MQGSRVGGARVIMGIAAACITGALAGAQSAPASSGAFKADYVVSPHGNDAWSGRLAEPSAEGADGPFATLERARAAVTEAVAKGLTQDLTIALRAGRHELAGTLRLGPEQSGSEQAAITWAAWPGERPVVSGGRVLTGGWQKGESERWTTLIPEVRDGKWWFRQLVADGKSQPRSRWPNAGEFANVTALDDKARNYTVSLDREIPWNVAGQDAEIMMYQVWSISRGTIYATQGANVELDWPIGWQGHDLTSPKVGRKLYLEHALAFVDQPGEWFLDRDTGVLTWQGSAGQDPNQMTFIAPRVERLVELAGTSETAVRNMHFQGIAFEDANWQLPARGFSGTQAGVYGTRYKEDPTYMLPPAIFYTYAEDCRLERCRVAHTGALGLAYGAGARRNRAIGNEFFDVGANPVTVGWRAKADDAPRRFFENDWDNPEDAPLGQEIAHNTIHDCGTMDLGAVGVALMFSPETRVAHNHIFNMPYTGISVGFIWGDQPSTMRACVIEQNHIHDVMREVFDGGGVYTLGFQPGTVVRNNLIYDVYHGHGLYTDEGSAQIVMENNVVCAVGGWGYLHHYGHHNTLRNNIIYAANMDTIVRIRGDHEPSFDLNHNIVVMDEALLKRRPWFSDEVMKEFLTHWNVPHGLLLFGNRKNEQFAMDYNLYWDATGVAPAFDGGTFAQWQQRGHDQNSVIADPMFANPDALDFGLKAESPALKLGFQPIDMSQVGPAPEYR